MKYPSPETNMYIHVYMGKGNNNFVMQGPLGEQFIRAQAATMGKTELL